VTSIGSSLDSIGKTEEEIKNPEEHKFEDDKVTTSVFMTEDDYQ